MIRNPVGIEQKQMIRFECVEFESLQEAYCQADNARYDNRSLFAEVYCCVRFHFIRKYAVCTNL